MEKQKIYLKIQNNITKSKKNPLPILERKTNELIKWLNKIDFTGNKTKLPSVLQKFNTSKAYELIKIHKIGFPVRPIISTVNSPT